MLIGAMLINMCSKQNIQIRVCVCGCEPLVGVWVVAMSHDEQPLSFHGNPLTQSVSMATDNSISWFGPSEGSHHKAFIFFFLWTNTNEKAAFKVQHPNSSKQPWWQPESPSLRMGGLRTLTKPTGVDITAENSIFSHKINEASIPFSQQMCGVSSLRICPRSQTHLSHDRFTTRHFSPPISKLHWMFVGKQYRKNLQLIKW